MAVLKKLVITATGEVGPGKGYEQLRKWVEANGGKWVPRVTKGVTHLICSKEHWKKSVDAVQTALRLGAYVVSYDWLEDCLQGKRKLVEKKYTWNTISKERRKRRQIKRIGKKVDAMKFQEGCEKAREETGSGTSRQSSSRSRGGFFVSSLEDLRRKREAREAEAKAQKAAQGPTNDNVETSVLSSDSQPAVSSQSLPSVKLASFASIPRLPTPSHTSEPNPNSSPAALVLNGQSNQATTTQKTEKLTDNYHIYLDNSGFEYNITLVRSNLYQNSSARYNIRVFESNTKPHVYCTFIRYVPPGGTAWPSASGIPTIPTPKPTNPLASSSSTECPTVHPELARAISLIQPPTSSPSPTQPFRLLIAPQNSDFPTAFQALRTAFRELTLLSWEERLDPSKSLQKARAKELAIEPFIYTKPKPGLPIGLMPAIPFPDENKFLVSRGNGEDEGLGLPGTKVPLSREFTIGFSLYREEEEVRKLMEFSEQKAAPHKQKLTLKVGVKKPWQNNNNNKPLFNGVRGRPQEPQEWEKAQKMAKSKAEATVMATRPEGRSTRWAKSPFFGFQR